MCLAGKIFIVFNFMIFNLTIFTKMFEIIDITDKDIELDARIFNDTQNIEQKKISNYPKVTVYFPTKYNYKRPRIHELYEINLNEGYIHFKGQFYFQSIKDAIDENTFAYKQYIKQNKNEYRYLPCDGMLSYKPIEEDKVQYFLVKITDMEHIEDTSSYFYDEEEGLNICLFPTAKMKIFFTIIEEFTSYEDAKTKLESIFTDVTKII